MRKHKNESLGQAFVGRGDGGEETSSSSFPLPTPVPRELARLRFLEATPPKC